MKVSLTPQAEQELTEGALSYAREANAELGQAFISELGGPPRYWSSSHALAPSGEARYAGFHCAASLTASFTTSAAPIFGFLRSRIGVAGPASGAGVRSPGSSSGQRHNT